MIWEGTPNLKKSRSFLSGLKQDTALLRDRKKNHMALQIRKTDNFKETCNLKGFELF